MSNVNVPFGDSAADTATLLLAAAAEKGLEPSVVTVDTGVGHFSVPEEVAKAAGVDTVNPDADFEAEIAEADKTSELPSQPVTNEADDSAAPAEASAPAKKAAAKKAPAKKAAAKKSPAKKAGA